MKKTILGIVAVLGVFIIVICIVFKIFKPQPTGPVKEIEVGFKGIKIGFHSPQPYKGGILELPPDNPIRKGFDDAVLAMDEYKWDEAIGIFRKLLPDAEGKQKVALLGLIGLCFDYQSEFDQALGSYKESLELARKIQDKKGEAAALGNIGLIYDTKGELEKAMEYYNEALRLFTEIGAKREIEWVKRNIAEIKAKR